MAVLNSDIFTGDRYHIYIIALAQKKHDIGNETLSDANWSVLRHRLAGNLKFQFRKYKPSHKKTGFLHLCENKDADQLHRNREADQRLCFRYSDSTIPLLPKSKISSL